MTASCLDTLKFLCPHSVRFRVLVMVLGPSVLPMIKDVIPAVLSILRCMNTARDMITISAEAKKQGKKNRRKPVAAQIGKPSEIPTQMVESFVWSQRPDAVEVFVSAVRFVSAVVQKGRFVEESVRLELDLELFTSASQLMSPSPVHRSKHNVRTSRALRESVEKAIRASCAVECSRGV